MGREQRRAVRFIAPTPHCLLGSSYNPFRAIIDVVVYTVAAMVLVQVRLSAPSLAQGVTLMLQLCLNLTLALDGDNEDSSPREGG
jgi:hypothetical protein